MSTVTTVENEYPFLSYVEEAGGPAALGARREVAVYTAGFPTPALVSTLVRLAERVPAATFRHWGDADVGGLRIWSLLRARLRRPVALYRTTAAWLRGESARGGRALTALERHALGRLRSSLESAEDKDAAEVRELIDALLELGLKLEQERF